MGTLLYAYAIKVYRIVDLCGAVLTGALLTLFFTLKCYPKCLKQMETKHTDTPQSSGMHTYLIDNWGACLDDQMFRIFCNNWIDCRDAFHTVLCL